MNYYKTQEEFPVKTNCPQKGWQEIPEQEYRSICDKRNREIEEETKAQEEEMQSVMEREKKIKQKMYEMAEKELIDAGEITEKR